MMIPMIIHIMEMGVPIVGELMEVVVLKRLAQHESYQQLMMEIRKMELITLSKQQLRALATV